MTVEYYRVNPNGNITLIVDSPVPWPDYPLVAELLMEADATAEQVGFFAKPHSDEAYIGLQMMGGEFCGNATLSAAALLIDHSEYEQADYLLEVSGAKELVPVHIEKTGTGFAGTVTMPLPESVDGTRVRFPGICHVISEEPIPKDEAETLAHRLCKELGADALGLMQLDLANGLMTPLVYVPATGTSVWESSCASGTAAVAAYLAVREGKSMSVTLRQPGGILRADAEFADGEVKKLLLHGSALIEGKYEFLLNS